jgi:flagellar motor switch protein FliN
MPDTMNAPTETERQEQAEPAAEAPASPGRSSAQPASMEAAPERSPAKTPVREVQLPEAPADTGSAASGQFDILLDMNVPISVVLGETQIPIRRLLQLGPGSVLKLDKPIEVPADLYLKDSKFAEVDVVVVEDRFAVRIKKILGAGAPANA